jgi:hypothetical protein
MEPITSKKHEVELELNIEELEQRIAPDGGETVLPLSPVGHGHKK